MLCKELLSRLVGRVSKWLSEDEVVKRVGVVFDIVVSEGGEDIDMLGYIVDEFLGEFVVVFLL